MTTNNHIAAIKEHLKAIEAEKQPNKESKRYLMVPVDEESVEMVANTISKDIEHRVNYYKTIGCLGFGYTSEDFIRRALKNIFKSGKIITVNDE